MLDRSALLESTTLFTYSWKNFHSPSVFGSVDILLFYVFL